MLPKRTIGLFTRYSQPKTIIKKAFISTETFMSSNSRLKNKTVFITGATSGIGLACAWNYARAGAHLVLSGRRADKLEEISAQLKESVPGTQVYTKPLDVRDKVQVDSFVHQLPQQFKNVDILVNNAGLVLGLEPLEKISEADMDTMLNTNVKGLVFCTQALLPSLRKTGGHIVNIGSIAGLEAYKNGSIYCASKHAVKAITQSLRCELLDSNVKITVIDPGMVETEFSLIRFRGDADKAAAVYAGIDPLKSQDIAEIVVFATSRPKHVEISNLTVYPHGQASATQIHRKQ
ncbi:hypothetical protein BB561_004562 [Smittium simulii]|uniref:NAD(P)-binding protein n=1 Tax=Smittium simulii TaxID=133385 RepID=A0A2T9YFI2_9FUNG|nr:hypothetical protein BB561_004562 [Smittium simulii]